MKTVSYLLVLLIIIVTIAVMFHAFQFHVEGFDTLVQDYRSSSGYKTQVALVHELQEIRSNGRRDYNDMLQASNVPVEEQCLVNFYSLGCRFTGYLGPFIKGCFDTDTAVLAALKMGCRTLVLEIDSYPDICKGSPYPRLVVRDKPSNLNTTAENCINGANVLDPNSETNQCQTADNSNIFDTCTSIARYAFSNSVPNPADPLIIVLYILRIPSEDVKIKTTFFSDIAKGLQPLLNNAVNILASGGNYSRQAQESALLSNPISTYAGQTLFFCNADTSVFRTQTGIPTNLDLDFIVNLRLSYTMGRVGCATQNATTNSGGTKFGLLESVGGYTQIPDGSVSSTQAMTKSTWTLCLDTDPSQIVPEKSTDQLMQQIGVHCIPIQMWSKDYDYMFDKNHFGKWSFIPKPQPLRQTIPATSIPASAAPQTNSNGGQLRMPTTNPK